MPAGGSEGFPLRLVSSWSLSGTSRTIKFARWKLARMTTSQSPSSFANSPPGFELFCVGLAVRKRPNLELLEAGHLKIDFQKRLLWRAGEEVHLSPTEFDLLAFMMKNAGAPLTHVKLLRTIWGQEYGNELEYLRAYVRMLRKKIETDPARPEYILTEPWVGYRFRNPSDPDSPSIATDEE